MRRLTDQIAEWVEQALADIPDAEDVVWDVGLAMAKDGPLLVFTFFAPGAIVGSMVTTGGMVQNPGVINQQNVVDLVRSNVEGLHKQRSEQLEQIKPGLSLVNNGGSP